MLLAVVVGFVSRLPVMHICVDFCSKHYTASFDLTERLLPVQYCLIITGGDAACTRDGLGG